MNTAPDEKSEANFIFIFIIIKKQKDNCKQ
jgi:hypothetical protein